MGHFRFGLVVLAALLAAFAVWTWLPPTGETKDAVKRTLVAFESQKSFVWPSAYWRDASPSPAALQRLLDDRALAWRAVADGDLLVEQLRADELSLRRSLRQQRARPEEGFAVGAGGRVALFDVRRRTLRGELLVRAAVVRWVQAARWDERLGELVALERRSTGSAMIKVYVLRQVGDAWRVVSAEQVDEPPFFYDAKTGGTGTGP